MLDDLYMIFSSMYIYGHSACEKDVILESVDNYYCIDPPLGGVCVCRKGQMKWCERRATCCGVFFVHWFTGAVAPVRPPCTGAPVLSNDS